MMLFYCQLGASIYFSDLLYQLGTDMFKIEFQFFATL